MREITLSRPTEHLPLPRLFGAYLEEARSECLRYLRAPGFMLPVLLFPALFYLLFGVLLGRAGGADGARYLLASYSVFGVMSPGLFGFGVSLALERDGGLLTLKRALPTPPGAYLLGKMLMAMVVAGLVVLLLLAIALLLAHVPLTPRQTGALLCVGVLGVLPFCALGMFVGTLIKGQSAPGLLNLIYLPMSFLSGLWLPLHALPQFLQRIAPAWPSYHLDRLAMAALGMHSDAPWPHVLTLAACAAGFLLLAIRGLHRRG